MLIQGFTGMCKFTNLWTLGAARVALWAQNITCSIWSGNILWKPLMGFGFSMYLPKHKSGSQYKIVMYLPSKNDWLGAEFDPRRLKSALFGSLRIFRDPPKPMRGPRQSLKSCT